MTDHTRQDDADQPLPGLAHVRDTENPDPGPVADLPLPEFALRAPAETEHTQTRLMFEPVTPPALVHTEHGPGGPRSLSFGIKVF